jgi:uncharacterized membrane protein (TIGR02234 family)
VRPVPSEAEPATAARPALGGIGAPGTVAKARGEYLLALLLGAAGGGLILLALRQTWAHAVYTPPHPLPAQDIAVSGQKLAPLASGLAIAGLACLAAVIATRGLLRRAAGVLLALIGTCAVAAAAAAVTSGAVLAAAASGDSSAVGFSGSTTSGAGSGAYSSTLSIVGVASGHAVITGLPWRAAAVVGGLAIGFAGVATAWRGTGWPVMSARYEQPAERAARQAEQDSATMWESLSRDVDPTVTGSAETEGPETEGPDEVDFAPDSR